MTINLHLPSHHETLRPRITVIGVGGAGGNAVNNMIAANLEGVDFVIANTDAQALQNAMTDRTIQLGVTVTRGLGAGADPERGRTAAEEVGDDIADAMEGSHMLFITAGMGGGTGTGAAPVVAQMARDMGILTVGVVTKPFHFEGTHRMRLAERGIEELQSYVDTLIVIPNQNLFRIANEKTTFADAFRMADEVLHSGVRGVTDLIVKPGLVNLDFADIRAVMSEMGKAMMGTGEAVGDKRAIEAAESAISNPLLDDVSLKGARAVLINITGGPDMTLFEVDEAANRIRDEVDPDANIIFGSTFSDALEGKMRVSVVATGIEAGAVADRPLSDAQRRAANAAFLAPAKREQAPAPRQAAVAHEQRRERTAAEIVRQSGNSSAVDLVRMAQEKPVQQERMAERPAVASAEPAYAPEMKTHAPQMSAPQDMEWDAQGRLLMDEPSPARKGPLKLGEIGADAPFIAPRAEQPAARTVAVSQTAARAAEVEDAVAAEDEETSAFNFFQKIAGVGKALSGTTGGRADAPSRPRQVVSNPGPKAEVRESTAAGEDDEEYLDIPAFLRRQAN